LVVGRWREGEFEAVEAIVENLGIGGGIAEEAELGLLRDASRDARQEGGAAGDTPVLDEEVELSALVRRGDVVDRKGIAPERAPELIRVPAAELSDVQCGVVTWADPVPLDVK
jgi:hypothetical protein